MSTIRTTPGLRSPATASASGYGSYTLTAAGVWTYTLNNSNPAVQALNAGQTLIDRFTVITVDGTSQVVTITIDGANDAAVITGVASGSVTEASGVANGTPGAPIAFGNLNSTDVDNTPDAWMAVATPLPTASGYGRYTASSGMGTDQTASPARERRRHGPGYQRGARWHASAGRAYRQECAASCL